MHQAPGLLTWRYRDESQFSSPGTHSLVGEMGKEPPSKAQRRFPQCYVKAPEGSRGDFRQHGDDYYLF